MRIFFFIGTIDLLLGAIGFFYYRHNLPAAIGRSSCFAVAYLLLTANAALSRPLAAHLPPLLSKLSFWLDGLWMAFGYYTLLFAVLHLLLYLGGRLLQVHLLSSKLSLVALICSCLLLMLGTYRAFHPNVRTEAISTSKLSAGTHYRIALISDVHLGRILDHGYAESLVKKLNGLHPDMVLIAGDLLDEKLLFVNDENSLAPFKNITAPKGVYLAFGNHDYLDDPAKWHSMVEAQNITVLRDRSALIDGALKLVGLNDFSHNRDTASLQKLAADNDKYYSILIDHQPRKMAAAAQSGYDLYLSGHTHTGQLFPNRQVTKRIYQLDFGRTELGSLTAITSSGYGFWGPPVRTEAAPEIVLIELSGK